MEEEKKQVKKKVEAAVAGTGKIDVLSKYNVSGKMLSQAEIDMLVKRYKGDNVKK